MGVRDPQEPLQARKLAGLSQEAPHPAWLQKLRRNPARPQPHLCTRCRGNSQRWRRLWRAPRQGERQGREGRARGPQIRHGPTMRCLRSSTRASSVGTSPRARGRDKCLESARVWP